MSSRLEFAVKTATECGCLAMQHFQRDVGYQLKEDESPVTIADRQIEEEIRKRIEDEFPHEPILGEEQGGAASGERWVIDPIDGTKSFIAGVPLFATLLSYEVEGKPRIGVCYFPALDEIVCAQVGRGAFWNGAPCRVSDKSRLETSIVCIGSLASMQLRGVMKGVTEIANKALATRGWGDAYGHALVATGRAEAMIDPLVQRWDISAMSVIVREAGGSFTDLKGQEPLSNEALSCAPGLKDTLVRSLEA